MAGQREEDAPPFDGELDAVDLSIIELLSGDARHSMRSLSRLIGMSASAVSERVTRLEQRRVIRGYHADIDPGALGYRMQVIIGVQAAQRAGVAKTVEALLAAPEIVSVHLVTGNWDLIVIAQVRDQHHLRDLIVEQVWSIPGFRHSETMLVLDTHGATP